jgi:hypothetical protein
MHTAALSKTTRVRDPGIGAQRDSDRIVSTAHVRLAPPALPEMTRAVADHRECVSALLGELERLKAEVEPASATAHVAAHLARRLMAGDDRLRGLLGQLGL